MAVLQPAPVPHTIDTSLAASDTVAPSVPVITSLEVAQYKNTIGGAKCAPVSNVTIDLATVTDNASPAAKLGYQLELVAGKLPHGLTLPAGPVRPGESDAIDPPHFVITFGDSNQDVDFTLAVKAVDEAGNVSASSAAVQVIDHATGCNMAGASSVSTLAFVLVAGFALRRFKRA